MASNPMKAATEVTPPAEDRLDFDDVTLSGEKNSALWILLFVSSGSMKG